MFVRDLLSKYPYLLDGSKCLVFVRCSLVKKPLSPIIILCLAMTRYKLKYSPEVELIIATLPGHVTANIATPSGWPLPGFTLHLDSLVPSAKASDLNPSGILQQCVVICLHLEFLEFRILFSCTLKKSTPCIALKHKTSCLTCPRVARA